MRTLLLIIAFSGAILASCNSKKSVANEEQTAVYQKDTVVMLMVEEKAPQDSLVLSFERTACFGRCPIYKIRAYQSGFVTYEGINFTEKLGLFSSRMKPSSLLAIFEEAEEIGYFQMADEYNNENVTDLPSVISMINMNDKKKRIVARINVPQELKDFHSSIDEKFNALNWTNYKEK